MPTTKQSGANFGILFFKRQWRLFGIMFQSIKSRSSIMFIILIVLSLLMQVVIYEAGLVPSMYFEVLGAKDYEEFQKVAVYSIEIIILNALMKSTITYLSRMIYVKWRSMVCDYLHNRYFMNNEYYKLNVFDPSLDNIDQRIVRDVNMVCQEWSTLMSQLVVIPFTIGYYSYQCFKSTTYLGPIIIYCYFFLGTLINRFVMAPIIRLTMQREKHEGDFRFQHLQVRVNAESMAFYDAERIEKYKSNKRLNRLLQTQKSLYGWSYLLNSTVNIFDYVGGILSYLIIAIPIFGGQYDDLAPEELSAEISKNSFVCIYLIHSFSQLFDMARTISDIAGHTHRIGELIEEFDIHDSDEPSSDDAGDIDEDQSKMQYQEFINENFSVGEEDEIKETSSEVSSQSSENQNICFELKNVTCLTPDGASKLLKDLNLIVTAGKNLLVTGHSGCGKTSLFRIMGGLWRTLEGTVDRLHPHGQGGVMFLPQKPLCTDGTLKQMIVYPALDGYRDYSLSTDDAEIMQILDEVGLSELYDRMGGLREREEINWADKLSPGEMQRISFARLFYHKPLFAVLDEPTSALNMEFVDQLFEFCKKRNITYVTAGHSKILLKHHDVQLNLLGDGNWEMTTLM